MTSALTVEAVFSPKRLEDLKDCVRPFIGRRGAFRRLWVIDEGPDEGQMAMELPKEWIEEMETARIASGSRFSFADGASWVPFGDLTDVKEVVE